MTTVLSTINEVRVSSGAPEALISDDDIKVLIDRISKETLESFNIKIEPTKNIDLVEIVTKDYINTKKTPLLSVTRLKQNNYNLELTDISFNSVGTIRKSFRDFRNYNVILRKNNLAFVEYYYGWLEVSDHKELTTDALYKGENKEITVSDISYYSVGDWVRIKGFDNNVDVAKITVVNTSTNVITLNKLYLDHETESIIEILEVPQLIKSYVTVQSALAVAVNAIGGTYTIATSYSLGPLSNTKGVPYTHWNASFEKNTKLRDELKARIEGYLIL